MIIDKVKDTIIDNSLIDKGEHVVIGLSGGPDSICLFHILYQLKEELGIELHAVHINHGLRPGAADDDQKYVEEFCAANKVPCDTFSFDVNRIASQAGISSEDAGRQVRYQSFYEAAQKVTAMTGASVKIAVAQNLNYQAETVLMRIIRGTGTDGLGGIEYLRKERENATIIRPLLDITRDEIEEYCRTHDLNPRIDLTNLEPIYTRNKIRLELLPYIRDNFNTNILAAINRLSKIAKEDKDYLYQRVEAVMNQDVSFNNNGRACIPLDTLKKEHPAIRHRVILKIFERIGLTKDVTAVHLLRADRLLEEGRTSSAADITAGYVMEISYTMVEFYKKTDIERMDFEYKIEWNNTIMIAELNAEIRVNILNRQDLRSSRGDNDTCSTGSSCFLSFDKIKACGCRPVVRTRRQGDFIRPLGMKGRKKLQDFFVDEKFAREERESIPLLCIGSEVLWVIGSRVSEPYKVEADTEQIILLEYLPKI